MNSNIAIVGMACRYPDARTPSELWENALARRRAFRRMPDERMRLNDYLSSDPGAPDRTYVGEAAVIEGYEFDRVRFRVAGNTYRSTDLAHWLALDVAAQALEDAGFSEGEGLPREMTGVVLGNTLTGEFSRASLMRLRWPYVRRVVEARLAAEGWPIQQRSAFLNALETEYKAPFPEVGEETLAGGLSNTIAGRICNYFDLKGGGYTVDGACASSLLAIITACQSLAAGDLDVALAGGVDLSLDPFEIVGFAKTGALAPTRMRVYDLHSEGFWPGEGSGFLVLMRHEDALAGARRIYAVIRGWGVSSDGSGGITRPELDGQLLAIQRAYHRAGFGVDTVAYFEGHGTGTSVGDATELQALSRARKEAAPSAPPAAIGTIKANIGHTKAAAGVAGLIKATMALGAGLLPPTTGCEEPHLALTSDSPALRVLTDGEAWPPGAPLRAAVSAMGFGGINSHVVLEAPPSDSPRELSSLSRALLSSYQDTELFLFSAQGVPMLQRRLEHVQSVAAKLSLSELADLSAELERTLQPGDARAAIVASTPTELAQGLQLLRSRLEEGAETFLDASSRVFFCRGRDVPRIVFLFPGQGSPARLTGGLWRSRFDAVRDVYAWANLPQDGDGVDTHVAQPAIVTASLAALSLLDRLDIRASAAVGHSLGELTALYWGGAIDREALLRIARARGRAMAELGSPTGAMASIRAEWHQVERLLNGGTVVLAGLNSPQQTVISGEAAAVSSAMSRARSRGLHAVKLQVSHAFHSPLVAAAVPAFAEALSRERFGPLQRTVASTVTGALLGSAEDLPALLCRQVTAPVRFLDAASAAIEGADLLVEVGPGRVLAGLASELTQIPTLALDSGGPSLRGLLETAGAAFALGAPVNHAALFAGRFTRPFNLDWQPRFFVNPCELAPIIDSEDAAPLALAPGNSQSPRVVEEAATPEVITTPSEPATSDVTVVTVDPAASALEIIRQLVAERAELPATTVRDDSRMLSDLHLNSITVGKLVSEAARRLGAPPPIAPTEFADSTVREIAQALEELALSGGSGQEADLRQEPPGVDSWIRSFTVAWVERPLLATHSQLERAADERGGWEVIAPADHPLAEALQQQLSGRAGGVVVCLPDDRDTHYIDLLVRAAHAALGHARNNKESLFVLVQHAGGAAGLARTFHLETNAPTCVVDVPQDHPGSLDWVLAEVAASASRGGYSETRYGDDGRRWEPVLQLLEPQDSPPLAAAQALGQDDVLLVTGGGKGIAAECALALARQTGVRLALVGRSQPGEDVELTANLERLRSYGIRFTYLAANVTDEQAVRDAVRQIEAELGPVTAVLHGAGANKPQLLGSLDLDAFLHTLAPKVRGLQNVLDAIDPDRVKLVVAFGSIIARTGLVGEADYALANEWLADLVDRWQVEHQHCRCLTVEWSVWSGVGMGERLGRVEALALAGITPIPPEVGVATLQLLASRALPSTSVVVTGRFGMPPTLKIERPELPFLRFLEQTRAYYPGVELVVDCELSADSDPYLLDHVYQGDVLLPAVLGLEAMAQVMRALAGPSCSLTFADVEFRRPVVLSESAPLTIRMAALVQEKGVVEVVLRSSESSFQVDHFRAVCLVGCDAIKPDNGPAGLSTEGGSLGGTEPERILPLDPEEHLYGSILFHRGRFRRVSGYRELKAKECLAELATGDGADWFGRYYPQGLSLGDPGMRDAVIHSVQACIPHATLLPVGVERLTVYAPQAEGPWLVHARERSHAEKTFVYDLRIVGRDGSLVEEWKGLQLRRVAENRLPHEWPVPLLSPYLERRMEELAPEAGVSVVLHQGATEDRDQRRDQAIKRLLGKGVEVCKRPDGKPEVPNGPSISVSHAPGLTMVVAAKGVVGCDIQPVGTHDAQLWPDLLGTDRFALAQAIAGATTEGPEIAACRVWSANECLKKAGATVGGPLVLNAATEDGWVLLSSGPFVIASLATHIVGADEPVVLSVLTHKGGGD